MKKLLTLPLIFLTITVVTAQSSKTVAGNNSAKSNLHIKAFNLAAATGDINTGIIALNYYIAEQGEATAYADTLAMLYMQQGAYAQCYYWANKRSQVKPDDNDLLEMKGICLDKLKQPKESIAIFEKLFQRTQSPYHAYKLMEMQYTIKRLAECVVTANAAEKLQFKPDYTMTYNAGEQLGRTYLQAGVFNIHGLALYDLDKKAEAKSYFEKAVALDSNFVLARQNLQAMRTIESNGNTINPISKPVTSPVNKQN